MEILNIVVAALASYMFGAIWYMSLSKPWMAATGMTEADLKDEDGNAKGGPTPYIIAFVCALVVASMMNHVFGLIGVISLVDGLLLGLGIGLFIAAPWTATHYSFSNKPRLLILIDAGYSSIGCAIMGFVLMTF